METALVAQPDRAGASYAQGRRFESSRGHQSVIKFSMDTISAVDIGYIAGLIDGEGSILLRRRSLGRSRVPAISVANNSRGLVEWLRQKIGGSLITKRTYGKNDRTAYEWRVKDAKAMGVLAVVAPYLRDERKKARAELILAEYPFVKRPPGHKFSPEQFAARLDFEERFFALGSGPIRRIKLGALAEPGKAAVC
jgi:hypothetical protein